ncbi:MULTISPECIES: hypothetical protein [Aquimarina]|uniref:hypothetical protein n=1 Tax=Aquimarina TaxID=290174 RepID=UPI00117F61CE|nr:MULTISPECIES: hypothetical protein [Aquimarina]
MQDRLDEEITDVIEIVQADEITESQETTSLDDIMQAIKNSEEFKTEVKAFEKALSSEELTEATEAMNLATEQMNAKLFDLVDARNNGGSFEEYREGVEKLYTEFKSITPDGIENIMTNALEEKFGSMKANNVEVTNSDNFEIDENSVEIANLRDVDLDEISAPKETPAVEVVNIRDIER